MTILLYYPFNKRTIPIDVPLFALKKRGHNLLLLTMAERGQLHDFYEVEGIQTFSHKSNNLILKILELICFCKKNKVDAIHAHLQQSMLVALLSSPFISCKVLPFRHHCKFHDLVKGNALKPLWKEVVADRIINYLAKKIIVPSKPVKSHMVNCESVDSKKIMVIPYMYRFDQMRMVSEENIASIRAKYPAKIRIIMVSRLTPFKRHSEALKALIPLVKENDIQVLIMDTGPELNALQSQVESAALNEKIHFLGFQNNILEYIAASDIMIHPSITDASNSAIKEAGLFEKVVIVCDRVGDFNDYIVNEKNGYLLSPDNFSNECFEILQNILHQNIDLKDMGKKLRQSVIDHFSYDDTIVDQYENL